MPDVNSGNLSNINEVQPNNVQFPITGQKRKDTISGISLVTIAPNNVDFTKKLIVR